jgi:hypothetical protein
MPIHGVIGLPEERPHGTPPSKTHRIPHGKAEVKSSFAVARLHRTEKQIRTFLDYPLVTSRQEHREFVAANAGNDIGSAKSIPKQFRASSEETVSLGVSERVVHELETIHVENCNTKGIEPPGIEPAHFLLEISPVVQAGEHVVERKIFELLQCLSTIRHVQENTLEMARRSIRS